MHTETVAAKLKIRNLVIDPPLLLAPMEGLTHSALRQVICGFGGAGLLTTEMISAKRLPFENPAVSPYLVRDASERPLSHQLLVFAAEEIPRAIDALHAIGADAVDLNLGCPSPTVGRAGGGVKLMERPEEVRRMVAEARKRTELPLTAKIRLGLEDEESLRSFCIMLEEEGIDLLSVHARFRNESFARKPRWEHIAALKERLRVPIVANGGIFSTADAEECLDRSGADGLMLGRGAVIKPWLFAQISRDLFGRALDASSVALPSVYYHFIDLLVERFRPEYRLGRLKQFTHYFAKNYEFGHHLASRVQSSASVEEAKERAAAFFETAPNSIPM